ncbi:uncharacterized protein PADG_12126 [Paracoccidioides brasiliensis Pb18]|uniref:Uncharacterized protein n=1 Tax=Paracoccidioides brasiliensis (strain Pb18) TaxID=502780 RepID=A0A0A0HWP2_PARBD|nr:uncharacterized protein PADG_12126 [Paracoccidioides brasiliensis Pb18]KGM91810.1 hypothetical protein PADG_12126 [Paracoccidioides brasiliensis Pb18]
MPSATPAPPPHSIPGLTASQLSSFRENGYLVLENYLSESEVTALLTTTNTLLSDFPLSTHPLTRFTTGTSTTSDTEANAKHIATPISVSWISRSTLLRSRRPSSPPPQSPHSRQPQSPQTPLHQQNRPRPTRPLPPFHRHNHSPASHRHPQRRHSS